MENFVNIWQKNLSRNIPALEFLASRGASEQQIERFRIGWSPRKVKISKKDNSIYYSGDRIESGFLLFPLTGMDVKVTGFISRSIEEKAYYKWTKDNPGAYFFGLDRDTLKEIWETEFIFLVEGPFDFFPLHRIYPNTLCLTSANLSVTQQQFLNRFTKRVYLFLDNDATGKQSSGYLERNLGLPCKALSLPYKDVGEAWEEWGDEMFKKYVLDQMASCVI